MPKITALAVVLPSRRALCVTIAVIR